MRKIEVLMLNHYDELNVLINNLYEEKYPPRLLTQRYGFIVGGKTYNNPKTNENYLNIIRDMSKVIGYKVFSKLLNKYVGDKYTSLCDSSQKANQVVKLSDNFYITTKTTSKIKIGHLKLLCEYLDIPFEYYVLKPELAY